MRTNVLFSLSYYTASGKSTDSFTPCPPSFRRLRPADVRLSAIRNTRTIPNPAASVNGNTPQKQGADFYISPPCFSVLSAPHSAAPNASAAPALLACRKRRLRFPFPSWVRFPMRSTPHAERQCALRSLSPVRFRRSPWNGFYPPGRTARKSGPDAPARCRFPCPLRRGRYFPPGFYLP